MVDIFYPLQWIADKVTYAILRIGPDTHLGASVDFIIYEVMKILILLVAMIFVVSYIRTYITPEKTRKALEGKKGLQYHLLAPIRSIRTYITPEKTRKALEGKKGLQYHLLASLLGAITPFCSCSAVPIFIGFLEAGVPLGVTFSFLIASPLVNEAAVAALWATIGLKATLIYVVSGIFLGVFNGYVIGLLKMEKYVADFVYNIKVGDPTKKPKELNIKERTDFAFDSVKDIVGRVWIYVIIGVALGGIFHGYAPEGILAKYAGKDNLFAVPIAVLIGVPLYSNVITMIPIVESLMEKGLPVGTALAFL